MKIRTITAEEYGAQLRAKHPNEFEVRGREICCWCNEDLHEIATARDEETAALIVRLLNANAEAA